MADPNRLSDRDAIRYLSRLGKLIEKYRDVPVPPVRAASLEQALALYDRLFPEPFGSSGERMVVATLWCELADKIAADRDAPEEERVIAEVVALPRD